MPNIVLYGISELDAELIRAGLHRLLIEKGRPEVEEVVITAVASKALTLTGQPAPYARIYTPPYLLENGGDHPESPEGRKEQEAAVVAAERAYELELLLVDFFHERHVDVETAHIREFHPKPS